jgi:hypothetical protein
MAYENEAPHGTSGQGNRFAFKVGRAPYADKAEYLRAISEQLTPDVWAAIVARAIHDATLGRKQERAKAREWFAKYILPIKTEIALSTDVRNPYDFLTEMYKIFETSARNPKDLEERLAYTLGLLKPEERATLRSVLIQADSDQVKQYWDEVQEMSEERQKGDSSAT